MQKKNIVAFFTQGRKQANRQPNPAGSADTFQKKSPASEPAIAITPKEKLADIVKGASQHEKDVTLGTCSAEDSAIREFLGKNGVQIRTRYNDHGYKIRNLLDGPEEKVEFEGIRLVHAGDSITIIRHRSITAWLHQCAEAITKCSEIHWEDGALLEFGQMLLERIKQDDARLHTREKYKTEFDFLMARAEFYNNWVLGIMNGTPAIFSQKYYYEPIAKATEDELFGLLGEAEAKLGAKDAYPIFRQVARNHGGFLSDRMAPVIVAVYDKIARFEKNTELRAKLYMAQLMNRSGSAENDAFCMRAIENIAPNFNNLLAASEPQAALDLLVRVCYDNYSDGYNKYSIGYAEFSGKNGGNGPLTRLKGMNKAAVEKAAELGIELKVGEYSVFRKGAFPYEVRWAG